MLTRIILEICAASVEDCIAAEQGGADRIELNTGLELGGLTPSLGLLQTVLHSVRLPVLTMVRSRPGGFCYSSQELQVMRRDAELALEHGASGIVFGMLQHDGRIDVPGCHELLRNIGAAEAVFHRAFDCTPEPMTAIEQLVDLGVTRVLTSGQAQTALAGAGLLGELVARTEGRLEILPAGGIRPENAGQLIQLTNCRQVHASLRNATRTLTFLEQAIPNLVSAAGAGSDHLNQPRVAALRQALDAASLGRHW